MERRDFLKYFGVGATVVPLAGGLLVPDASAKLIEVPKVEIHDKPIESGIGDLYGIFNARAAADTTITMMAKHGQQRWNFVAYIDQLNIMGEIDGVLDVRLRLQPARHNFRVSALR